MRELDHIAEMKDQAEHHKLQVQTRALEARIATLGGVLNVLKQVETCAEAKKIITGLLEESSHHLGAPYDDTRQFLLRHGIIDY